MYLGYLVYCSGYVWQRTSSILVIIWTEETEHYLLFYSSAQHPYITMYIYLCMHNTNYYILVISVHIVCMNVWMYIHGQYQYREFSGRSSG